MINTNRFIARLGPGKFAARPEVAEWKPIWLTIDASDVVLPVVVPAASTPYSFNVTQPQWDAGRPSLCVLTQLLMVDATDGLASSNFTVELEDNSHNRKITRSRQHVANLFGSAQLPGIFYEPLIIEPNGSIRMIVQKLSGGAVNIYPYFGGYEYVGPSGPMISAILLERKQTVWAYWMTPDQAASGTVISLAGNASVELTSQNSAHPFQGLSLLGKATGSFSVEIIEGRTRRCLSNGPILLGNGLGSAQYPHKFSTPFLIPPGGSIIWKITDLTGSTNNIFVAMQGKMFNCPMEKVSEADRATAIAADVLRVL